jgi:hypothetical protein
MTRRDWLALAVRALLVAALVATIPVLSARHQDRIECKGESAIFFLEAQAVPTATQLPCFFPLPAGWRYAESEVRTGLVRAWLDSDRVGDRAVELTMNATCNVSQAVRAHLVSPPPGVVRYDEPQTQHSSSSISYFRFEGGCVTYRFSFTRRSAPLIYREADRFLGFTPRATYVQGLQDQEGITLCGAGAPPCAG